MIRVRRITLVVPGLAADRAPHVARRLAAELARTPLPGGSHGRIRIGPLPPTAAHDDTELARAAARELARAKGGRPC